MLFIYYFLFLCTSRFATLSIFHFITILAVQCRQENTASQNGDIILDWPSYIGPSVSYQNHVFYLKKGCRIRDYPKETTKMATDLAGLKEMIWGILFPYLFRDTIYAGLNHKEVFLILHNFFHFPSLFFDTPDTIHSHSAYTVFIRKANFFICFLPPFCRHPQVPAFYFHCEPLFVFQILFWYSFAS